MSRKAGPKKEYLGEYFTSYELTLRLFKILSFKVKPAPRTFLEPGCGNYMPFCWAAKKAWQGCVTVGNELLGIDQYMDWDEVWDDDDVQFTFDGKKHFKHRKLVVDNLTYDLDFVDRMCYSNYLGNSDGGKIAGCKQFDLIATNPPFELAGEFLMRSLELVKPKGFVVFLLRLGWLESRKRIEFHKRIYPSAVYVIPDRPSFRQGQHTDSTAYAFFIYQRGNTGRKAVLRNLNPLKKKELEK